MADPNDPAITALLPTVQGIETGGLADPDNAVSKTGAVGRYQIMPATAKLYGVDPSQLNDPKVNEQAARAALADQYTQHGGDLKSTLIGYNASPAVMKKWQASGQDDSVLPLETQGYLKKAGLTLSTGATQGAPTPAYQSFQDKVSKARAAGYSWDEIQTDLNNRTAKARAAGYSDADIDKYLGYSNPNALIARLRGTAEENVAKAVPAASSAAPQTSSPSVSPSSDQTAKNPLEGFIGGLERSSGGLITRSALGLGGTPPGFIPPDEGSRFTRIASMAGEFVGDIPAMLAGATAGAAAGVAAGGPVGGVVGGRAGTFALPQAVKSEYADAYQNGEVKSASDFAERQMVVAGQVAKAAGLGVVVGKAGDIGGGLAVKAGAAATTATIAARGAEIATLTTGSSLMEGKLPKPEDIIDNALLVAGMHGALHVAGSVVRPIQKNLLTHWVKTDETPAEATQRAQQDPVFRQQMQVPAAPEPPPGSSETPPSFKTNPMKLQDEHDQEVQQLETEAAQRASAKGSLVLPLDPDVPAFTAPWNVEDEQAREDDRLRLVARTGLMQAMSEGRGGAPASLDDVKAALDQPIEDQLRAAFPQQYASLEAAARLRAAAKNRKAMEGMDYETPEAGSMDALAENVRKAKRLTANPQDQGPQEKFQAPVVRPEEPDLEAQFKTTFPKEYRATQREAARLRSAMARASYNPFGFEGAPSEMTPYDAQSNFHPDEQDFGDKFAAAVKATQDQATPEDQEALRVKIEAATKEGPAPETDVAKSLTDHIAKTEAVPLKDRLKDAAYQAYLELATPEHPLQELTRAIKAGGPLRDADNPDFLQRLAENSGTRAMAMIRDGVFDDAGNKTGPGLVEIMDRFKPGAETEGFRAYAVARWAAEKAAQAKETGVTLTDALKWIADNKDKYENSFKDLVGFQNSSLKILQKSGIVSRAQYDDMVTANTARIPGYREGAQPRTVPGAGNNGRSVNNPLKEFLGSDKKIFPIEQTIMSDTFRRFQLADLADRNRAAAEAAEALGLAVKTGEPKATTVTLSGLEGKEADTDAALTNLAKNHLQADEVPVFKNGAMTRYVFTDPNMARVLRGYDKPTLSTWQKIAGNVTNVVRNLIVRNPLFPLHILAYDIPFQAITNPENRNAIASVYTGLKDMFAKPEDYATWVRSGGADHVFEAVSQNGYIKDVMKGRADPSFTDTVWNGIKTPYAALGAWSRMLGSAAKFGRYQRGVASGETQTKAAFEGTQAAFHRAGAGGPVGKAMNAIQPFTTAYLNGLEKTFRAMTGIDPAGDKVFSWQTVATNHAMAAALITLPMIANWYEDKDKEWYKAAPDWQKDNGLLMNDGTHTFFVKYPPILSFIYGGLPRRMMESMFNDNPHAFDGAWKSAVGSFAPPGGLISYNVALPLIENMANHSFFRDAPLIPDSLKDVAAPEQYTENTSAVAIHMSRFFNDSALHVKLSPIAIDNLINGWGGSLGVAAVKYSEMAAGAKENAPTPTWSDMPLLSSFLARYPAMSAAPITDFENRLNQMSDVHGSLMQLFKSGDLTRFQQIAQQNPEAAIMHRFTARNVTRPDNESDYVSALRDSHTNANMPALYDLMRTDAALKAKREVAVNLGRMPADKMTPQEKRQQLDEIYAAMQQIAEHGIKTLNDMEASHGNQ